MVGVWASRYVVGEEDVAVWRDDAKIDGGGAKRGTKSKAAKSAARPVYKDDLPEYNVDMDGDDDEDPSENWTPGGSGSKGKASASKKKVVRRADSGLSRGTQGGNGSLSAQRRSSTKNVGSSRSRLMKKLKMGSGFSGRRR